MYNIKLSDKALDLIFNTIKDNLYDFEGEEFSIDTIAEEITNEIEYKFNKNKEK